MQLLPRTVRARATIAAALVVGTALAATGLLVVDALHRRLEIGQRDAAKLRARDIAVLISDGRIPSSFAIPGEDRALVQVVDARNTVLVQSINTAGEPSVLSASELRNAPFVTIRRRLPIGDGERYVVVAEKSRTPQGTLTIITAESLESADTDSAAVARLLVIGFPLVVALVTLIVLRTTKSAFHPVSTMTAELGEITSHDLHRRVSAPTADDEIGELGGAMNALLDRLERSSERERRFVADASHELRSPLASVRAALEVADTHPDKIDPHAAIRDALADHVRLDRLVDDLLALARLDGTHVANVDAVDLALLATVELASRSTSTARMEKQLERAIVIGDEAQLLRVLRNLLDNAFRHAGSTVRVTTTTVRDRVFVTVDDDGPGIPAEERHFVFERFSRRDNARAADDGGSGLGLAIVKEVVESHQGTVDVNDSPLGGARFTISLPGATSEAGTAPTDRTTSRFRRRSTRTIDNTTTTRPKQKQKT